ncbi:MAG: cation:proton antiporter [Campylobacterota bacterium]
MTEENIVIFVLGSLFILGLIADIVGRFTILPRVTILLICGVLIGPFALDLLPNFFVDRWFSIITDIALGMIGFLLGQNLTAKKFKQIGKGVVFTSLSKVLTTYIIVFILLSLAGIEFPIALIVAAIASPSAPAAIYDVIKEIKVSNKFSQRVLNIVAIDDVWGLIVFIFSMAVVGTFVKEGAWIEHTKTGVIELFGSIMLGAVFGLLVTWLTGRIQKGEPTQAEALGSVFLAVSIAKYFELSPILTTMILGAFVANFAHHHKRPFTAIEGLEWPFMIIFFLLAGASLHLDAIVEVGFIGIIYIIARTLGIYLGAALGSKLSGWDEFSKKNIGKTLFPQAGVAIGLALVAGQKYPEFNDTILPIIIGTTVFFELIGPVISRRVLQNSKKDYI